MLSKAKAWFGDIVDWKESGLCAIIMAFIVGLYAMIAYGTDISTWNPWEIAGTWMITVSIWLCRTENVQNWVWGILGTLCIGKFMLDIDLTGQMLLNWLYFVPISVWAWWNWARYGAPEAFPPSYLSNRARWAGAAGIVVASGLLAPFITFLNPSSQLPIIDSIVVVASIVAQYLLGLKKVESWLLWLGPVNALSVYLFWSTGAYVLAGLYAVYFIHAAVAIWTWTDIRKLQYRID